MEAIKKVINTAMHYISFCKNNYKNHYAM